MAVKGLGKTVRPLRVLVLLTAVFAVVLGIAGAMTAWEVWFVKNPAFDFAFDEWVTCAKRSSLRCRRVQVPVDHDRPDGPQLSIAVVKMPALSPPSRGTIIVHNGGPTKMVDDFLRSPRAAVAEQIRRHHDVITWDLRGLGKSEPLLTCPEAERLLKSDNAVATYDEAFDRSIGLMQAVRRCAGDFPLAHHVSLVDMAKDIDLIRAAAGVEKASLLFHSYASGMGVAYAALFPQRIERAVLTLVTAYPGLTTPLEKLGPLPPGPDEAAETPNDTEREQHVTRVAALFDGVEPSVEELEQAIDKMATDPSLTTARSFLSLMLKCHRMDPCPLGQWPITGFSEVYERVYREPLSGRGGQTFTIKQLERFLEVSLNRSRRVWPTLLRALGALHYESDPDPLFDLYFHTFSRDIADGTGLFAYASSCSHTAYRAPDKERWEKHKSPFVTQCDPQRPPAPHPLPAPATFPTVIIAGEEDVSTPPLYARRVAHQLDAPLVLMTGMGHRFAGTCGQSIAVDFLTRKVDHVESRTCKTKPPKKKKRRRIRTID